MKHQNLIKFLSPYLYGISRDLWEANINCGGCGHFAYNLSKALSKMNIEHEIVYGFGYRAGNYEDVNMLVNNQRGYNKKRLACSHAAVKIGNTFLDSNGVNEDFKDLYPEKISLTLAACKKTLERRNEYKGWNSDFDKWFLPKIRTRLREIPKLFESKLQLQTNG